MFRKIEHKTDLRNKLVETEEEIKAHTKYIFKKTLLQQNMCRVKMIDNLGLSRGPIYVICQLKILSNEKQLFVLELENGREVKIPEALSLSQWP